MKTEWLCPNSVITKKLVFEALPLHSQEYLVWDNDDHSHAHCPVCKYACSVGKPKTIDNGDASFVVIDLVEDSMYKNFSKEELARELD